MTQPKKVSLQFREEDLQLLVDALAIAHWVVCDGETMSDPHYAARMHRFQQLVYKRIHAIGNQDMVEYDDQCDYFDPVQFEEDDAPARVAMNEHDEENFWEDLIMRLSTVMAAREIGEAKWDEISEKERLMRCFAQEEVIREAIDEQGLACLFMKPTEPGG